MKTTILAATSRAFVPLTRKGVKASPTTMTASSAASQTLRGRSCESSRSSMASAARDRIQALRPPEQDRDHQPDAREHRRLRREEAGVVRHQADEQRADEAAERRAEAADDDDEDQDVDLAADLRHDDLPDHCPEAAAEAGERRAGDEDADEQSPDA